MLMKSNDEEVGGDRGSKTLWNDKKILIEKILK